MFGFISFVIRKHSVLLLPVILDCSAVIIALL